MCGRISQSDEIVKYANVLDAPLWPRQTEGDHSALMHPFDADRIIMHAVNPEVGNVRSKGPELLEWNAV